MALGDLKFYKETFSGKELVKSVRWMTSLPLSFKGEPADNIFDAWSSTGYRRPLDTDYVDLDLGECCLLSEVSFCPYLDVEYKEDEIYELCIWQNGWQVVTSGKGGKPLHFTDIPRNALWLIRPVSQSGRKHVRPFVYEAGEVYWY